MLAEIGIRQAIALGEKFQNDQIQFDAIISSSTPRAIQTAGYIFPDSEITITDSMRAKSSGDWEWKKKIDVYTDEYHRDVYWFIPPNGESYAMVNTRATEWFNAYIWDHPELRRIAIVSHDFAIKCMLSYFFDIPHSHIEDFRIGNAGQLIVEVTTDKSIKLIHWN